MNWFNDLRIRTKMIGGFFIVIVLTLIVGITGIRSSAQINDMLNNMYDNNLVPIAYIANANMQAIYQNRSLYDYVIETDPNEMKKSENNPINT